jgi:hypothetical protein
MKVYIAGPYTKGAHNHNVRQAILAGDQVAEAGFIPFIPHLCTMWDQLRPHGWEFWMTWTSEWLKSCDALIRLPGDSTGSDKEVQLAGELGLPVFYSVESFLEGQ